MLIIHSASPAKTNVMDPGFIQYLFNCKFKKDLKARELRHDQAQLTSKDIIV